MKKIKIFDDNGKDTGWIKNDQQWWFNFNNPDSFEIFDLDSFYSDAYFRNDHVKPNTVDNYVFYVKDYFKKLTGKDLVSLLEVGSAGGWFTKKFIKDGIDIIAIEGSKCGIEASLRKKIPSNKIIHHDLRLEINIGRKFDMACCTEVAEHIEPPFSSQLVKTLVTHSDIVWFSFEEPGTNSPHYHHCNEQPAKFWINLFEFYGHNYLEIPNDIILKCEHRAKYIFYNKNLILLHSK